MPRGRPRRFDRDAALEAALAVFWRRGYRATSLDDLTEAMGINRPSLYGAFGDKQAVFRAAVARYAQRYGSAPIAAYDAAADPAAGLPALFDAATALYTGSDAHRGCLIASGANECTPVEPDLGATLRTCQDDTVAALSARLAAAQEAGAVAADETPQAQAQFVLATMMGMATLARTGADADSVRRIGRLAERVLVPAGAAAQTY